MTRLYIGTAGWQVPARVKDRFPAEGTHLQRYAARFPAAEINSSFYRPHRSATYAKWAACVPECFRFSVKVPKAITHELRLAGAEALLQRFLGEVGGLGERLGCLLVQLPPSFAFSRAPALSFFQALRERYERGVAFEPRHPTWFEEEPEALLRQFRVARVAADPACVPAAAEPGGWDGLVYYRLHGSPRIYYSEYDDPYLEALAERLREPAPGPMWCIFDNTAMDAAAGNALDLLARCAGSPGAANET
jgi:uncharacterized protein YecE (DUF72 family)